MKDPAQRLLKILLISLTKSPALAIIFNSLCAKGDEKEEYAGVILTEKAAHRLRGAKGNEMRKVAFEPDR